MFKFLKDTFINSPPKMYAMIKSENDDQDMDDIFAKQMVWSLIHSHKDG